ncbi:hypothetical protein Tco_0827841 [Tanacetum coccineum]
MYSASVDEMDVLVCFFDDQLTNLSLRIGYTAVHLRVFLTNCKIASALSSDGRHDVDDLGQRSFLLATIDYFFKLAISRMAVFTSLINVLVFAVAIGKKYSIASSLATGVKDSSKLETFLDDILVATDVPCFLTAPYS